MVSERLPADGASDLPGQKPIAAVHVVGRPPCGILVPARVQRDRGNRRIAIHIFEEKFSGCEERLLTAFVVEPRNFKTIGTIFEVAPVYPEGFFMNIRRSDEKGRVRIILWTVRDANDLCSNTVNGAAPKLAPVSRRRLKSHGRIEVQGTLDLFLIAPVGCQLERLQIHIGRGLPAAVPFVKQELKDCICRI